MKRGLLCMYIQILNFKYVYVRNSAYMLAYSKFQFISLFTNGANVHLQSDKHIKPFDINKAIKYSYICDWI